MDEARIALMREKETTVYPLSQLHRAFDQGLDAVRDPARPTDPYSQVAWVYVCVQKIIDAAGHIPLMLSDHNDQIIESGPAYDFLFANPAQPLRRFLTLTLGYLALYRECYWVKVADDGTAAAALQVYGPNRLRPVVRRGVVVGYRLHLPEREHVDLYVGDVIPLMGFNPDVPYYGVGPLTSGKLDISSSYQATLYNEATMANGARIGSLLTVPAGVKLSDDEIAHLRAQFESRHAGARNAGRTAIMTGGVDIKVMSQTMAELQMIDLRRFDAMVICALFGVPPEVAGLNPEAQYAHGPAGQRFVTDTISPMLSFVADHLNDYVLPPYAARAHKSAGPDGGRRLGRTPLHRRADWRQQRLKAVQAGRKLWAWFATDDHPAQQQMLRDRAEKMLAYCEKGVPLNQIIDAGDLPFEHVPWGDHYFVSAGVMPAQWILDGGMDAVLGPPLAEGDTSGDGEPEKVVCREEHKEKTDKTIIEKSRRIWRKYVASWQPLERQFRSAMRTYFRRQKTELIKRLESVLSAQKTETGRQKTEDVIARVVIDLARENEKIRAIHRTFFERAAQLGAAQNAAAVGGLSGERLKETVGQVIRRAALQRTLVVSAHKIQNANATTSARIAAALRQGLADGEGLPQLRKRLETDFAFSAERAQRIARTHTGSAVSAGRHEAAQHLGADRKFWLTSGDEAVRKSHQQAQRDHAGGIPLDEAFKVGGDFLMYPGDPGGSAANVVNCRCMELVKRIGGKTLTLDDYDRCAWVDYNSIKSILNEAVDGD